MILYPFSVEQPDKSKQDRDQYVAQAMSCKGLHWKRRSEYWKEKDKSNYDTHTQAKKAERVKESERDVGERTKGVNDSVLQKFFGFFF